MHELSIAINIVEIAQDTAFSAKLHSISEIEIEVGDLSGVIIEALEFAMEEAVKNTILDGAERKITKIPAKAKCNNCSTEYDIEDVFTPCPKCSGFDNEILSGNELKIKTIIGNTN
ncbi:MAG: hydrogenase maturation nickel metallochaperone HypA [Bacteroidales bacterium]|jgi:hydrogenase nickel incorporation protein HypA/HybF|nr:hydrogenase maturation nickel metallochaperone HypA [Bacteroidales bacterium]MCK9498175.1 hydrogenase maturation nickel metallochaperone HypA [Bacteroidales bacterium]MDY0313494.1 hydrogenase maturation nickel metallochaperone HypA [Bacteroidales bacterium]NLB87506.1 hydrogenase maturation nickel metallochaperone HypA [Bacteroidales bacterium]